ncbi:uncharacterized protein LOC132603629 [Lycium barbarum]|uniref:uncharacterized protein LOC132603629 n=1 Tax=Lycium barbarum TaxID=112863 RepID=UPI00293E59B0|nr:uncharacterized protein LOC132603629 [Lycium barbarum]
MQKVQGQTSMTTTNPTSVEDTVVGQATRKLTYPPGNAAGVTEVAKRNNRAPKRGNLEKSSFYVAGVSSSFRDQILQELRSTLGEIPFKWRRLLPGLGVSPPSYSRIVEGCN